LHPLIPRKELITVKTIRATAQKEKIKTELSKPSRLRQIPASLKLMMQRRGWLG
jgi:hypothetical protein